MTDGRTLPRFDVLTVSLEALSRHRFRSVLSATGIICGVAAIVAMVSVTEGARAQALKEIASLGLRNVIVRERSVTLTELRGRPRRGLTVSDASVLRTLVPGVALAVPVIRRPIVARGFQQTKLSTLIATTAQYGAVLRVSTSSGRLLNPLDDQSAGMTCVLGASLAAALYGPQPAVGANVQLDKRWFRVVGVLADRGSLTGDGPITSDLNEAVIVPLSTFFGSPLGPAPSDLVSEIWIETEEGGDVTVVGQSVMLTLERLRGQAGGVVVVVPLELLRQRYRVQRTFAVVVGSVALLSLIVGGIGIMNVMLASVLERTTEIGLRRAVGATRADMLRQFLVEALLVTSTGATVGVALGAVASWWISVYAKWPTHVSITAVCSATAASLLVGVAAGIYPAIRASLLDPIDAVRYE